MTSTRYGIRVTKYYYGTPGRRTDWLRDETGQVMTFATREAARREVRRIDDTVYHEAHNESGRPTLRVVAIRA